MLNRPRDCRQPRVIAAALRRLALSDGTERIRRSFG
jgi:hypothetical protein